MEEGVVEVAVPRGVDRTFDYAVPHSQRTQIQVGVRVRVPFRGETLTGYVVGVKAKSHYPGALLEVEEVLDARPVVSETRLKLARWIGDRYLAPLGPVLQAMVPVGLRLRTPRTRPYVRLTAGLGEALQAVEELAPTAPKQVALLEALLAQGSELPREALLKRGGCSPSPLKALTEKGLVRIEHRPVSHHVRVGFREVQAELSLSPEQQACLEVIRRGIEQGRGRYLLHGVNASGKTEVYLQSVQHALEQGSGAIVVVPEISLTPQLIARLRSRFGEHVAIYHSGLTETQRAREWARMADGEAQVAVGVRAAVFAPLDRVGLIVVDEEHEDTYKQEEPQPRYHAREVALKRAELDRAAVVLGSATPALESYWRTGQGGLRLLELKERVVGGEPPEVRVVDLGGADRVLSHELKRAVHERLQVGEQSLLLLNRRGFSRCVLCRSCRAAQRCPGCQIALVYHLRAQRLVCHFCGRTYPVGRCRACGSRDLAYVGSGTERAEQVLREAFPGATLARMDSDAIRRGEHEVILESFRRGEIDILLGTQMIGLGLDFPNVTLVGVLSADTLLDLPEFRAGERTFQLISQAAGRAGRGRRRGEVIVQTSHPRHYAIACAVRGRYRAFFEEELRYRRALNYPPFSHLVKLTCEDYREEQAARRADRLAQELARSGLKGLEVLGPFPALPYRRRGAYRRRLVLKAKNLRETGAVIREILKTERLEGVGIDVDPRSLAG